MPGSLRNLQSVGMNWVPDMAEARNCCGFICFQKTCMHAFKNTMFGKMAPLPWSTFKKATNEKLWIICSYYGLDKAVCCPPNFKLIGSIGREPTELMRLLKEKDMKLYEWLQDAHAK